MFSKNTTTKLETILGPGTEIDGNIKTSESIRIDCKVKGEINAESIVIGEHGMVMGDISANKVTVAGKVKGNITATVSLELLPSGQIIGDIRSNKLVISDGASFEGNCQMMRSDGQVVDLPSKSLSKVDGTNLKVVGAKG
jgi:cytoskeletal protein CcmA (bactofilin family)